MVASGNNVTAAHGATGHVAPRRSSREGFAIFALSSFVAVLVAQLATSPLLMLTLSVVLVCAAARVAAIAWARGLPHNPERACAWDAAGLLALLGIAAALTGNPLEMFAPFEPISAAAPVR